MTYNFAVGTDQWYLFWTFASKRRRRILYNYLSILFVQYITIVWFEGRRRKILLSSDLKKNKRFVLDEMTWRNFFWICHILFIHKPTVVFSIILFRVVLFFSQMNALVYVGINQGINKRGIKYTIHQKFWKKFIIFFFQIRH